jgi:hypothetical protein
MAQSVLFYGKGKALPLGDFLVLFLMPSWLFIVLFGGRKPGATNWTNVFQKLTDKGEFFVFFPIRNN